MSRGNYTHSEKFKAKVLARPENRGQYEKTLALERWGASRKPLSDFQYPGETLAQTKKRLEANVARRLLKTKQQ